MILWHSDIRIRGQNHNITLDVILWYSNHEGSDIVIFYKNGSDRISQYHEGCDIVIFNKNGSDRISQYHMGCDIVIFNWKS